MATPRTLYPVRFALREKGSFSAVESSIPTESHFCRGGLAVFYRVIGFILRNSKVLLTPASSSAKPAPFAPCFLGDLRIHLEVPPQHVRLFDSFLHERLSPPSGNRPPPHSPPLSCGCAYFSFRISSPYSSRGSMNWFPPSPTRFPSGF